MAFSDENFPSEKVSVVRLFPLPNFVMFPGVLQPLRVFEERYIEMFEDALATDQLIAMALLRPGYEKDYDLRPTIFPMSCLGRVVTHTRLEDGTYNFLLQGLARITILEELPPRRSFREAQAQPTAEQCGGSSAVQEDLRQRLVHHFRKLWPAAGHQQLDQLLGGDVSLGMLTDLMSFAVPIESAEKQQLLDQTDSVARARMLLDHLGAEDSVDLDPRSFPPDFSNN